MVCIETSTSFGSQKFEGAAREFKGDLGSRQPLISSPVIISKKYVSVKVSSDYLILILEVISAIYLTRMYQIHSIHALGSIMLLTKSQSRLLDDECQK